MERIIRITFCTQIGVFDTVDPYGVASGVDSERSMVVNLAETDRWAGSRIKDRKSGRRTAVCMSFM